MGDTARPTRWEKAKNDWPGLRGKRELASVFFGGLLAAFALLLVSAPEAALQQVIVVLVAGAVAAILLPAFELYWAWLQAPMRLLTEDVTAVRHEIAALPRVASSGSAPPTAPAKPKIDVELTLRNFLRVGEELTILQGGHGYITTDLVQLETWTQEVLKTLANHRPKEDTRKFLEASTGVVDVTAKAWQRIAALREIVNQL